MTTTLKLNKQNMVIPCGLKTRPHATLSFKKKICFSLILQVKTE